MTARTYSSRARDQRVAEDVEIDRSLLCAAGGCPNRWSVDGPMGKCCSAHAWTERHHWPQVTQEQLDAETNRALVAAAPPAPKTYRHFSQAEKREVLQSLRTALGPRENPREWAHRLREREQRGERLSLAQRDMWRSVLGAHGLLDAALAGAPVPQERITEALVATGDIPWVDREDIPVFDPDPGMVPAAEREGEAWA